MNNLNIRELSTLHGSLLTATRKPILHDLSLFYALQKYFLKSSAIAPLAVLVKSWRTSTALERKRTV